MSPPHRRRSLGGRDTTSGRRSALERAGVAVLAALTLLISSAGASADNPRTGGGGTDWSDPVPRDQVERRCGLDPELMDLADLRLAPYGYVVVRYGLLCWRGGTLATGLQQHEPFQAFSVTKTMGALLLGVVAAGSSLEDTSRLTDYLSPQEIADVTPEVNPQARVAHVLGMTAASDDLRPGKRDPFSYDSLGDRELNVLVPLMDKVIAREPKRFEGVRNSRELGAWLFRTLGMHDTTWDGAGVATGMVSTATDMAKLGELILRRGRWGGQMFAEERWVYRMTHASFEDVNTGMGYLTWLNAAANFNTGTVDQACTPYPRWPRYPHAPFFEARDSNGGYPFADAPGLDIGAVWAEGALAARVAGHRGLDMVIALNVGVGSSPERTGGQTAIWNAIRPALLASIPESGGDEAAFCDRYRRGAWADLREPWSATASGPRSR